MTETALASNISNIPEYTVSDIAGAVKRMVEDHFGRVRVRGEISAWKVHGSGHAYFRLKDAGAVLDAVCWRGTLGKVGCKGEDGLEVIATGRISTYPGKSSYQIIVDRMEPAGAGALMALLEKRRAALAAEGLFAAERKKKLPFFPRVIGVATSPTGAVIRDILHRIADRFPVHVIVWPVAVQGEGAAEQIAAAIHGFNRLPPVLAPCLPHEAGSALALTAESAFIPRPDVLIVARGGGSVEDLWAFNEEIVVRAAAASAIPLISAVGHETDTTLIDFASDIRAPTPTAAAEMATPLREELRLALQQMGVRRASGLGRLLQEKSERIDGLKRGLPRPATLLEHATQRLDDWSERLHAAPGMLMAARAQALQAIAANFRPQLLVKETEQLTSRTRELRLRLSAQFARMLTEKERKVDALAQMFSALSHENVLKRGFALVKTREGALVTTAKAAREQKELTIVLQDGEVILSNPFSV